MDFAVQEKIENLCRELSLALRRITGRTVTFSPDELPIPVERLNGLVTEQEDGIDLDQ